MTDYTDVARSHYGAPELTTTIREMLRKIVPDGQLVTLAQLAQLDQFHTRGMVATEDLAALTSIDRSTRVLDLGCGIGGPARFLAATYGCRVIGVDLSESFIEAAKYLTERCGMEEQVSFQVGNALQLQLPTGTFDLVFLQHVAMNIEDRATLYKEIARVLSPGGKLAMYDVVLRTGEVKYPVPWARDEEASFLLTEHATREALIAAGMFPLAWRDDSDLAKEWFARPRPASAGTGLTLSVVLGPDFPALTANLGSNLAEGRIGILSAISQRR